MERQRLPRRADLLPKLRPQLIVDVRQPFALLPQSPPMARRSRKKTKKTVMKQTRPRRA